MMMTERRAKIFDLVSMGSREAVKNLIKEGCDVNEKSNTGNCAVMVAVQRNDYEMLAILIEAGARVDVVDGLNRTPLLYAKKSGFKRVVELLETTLASYDIDRPRPT